MDFNNNDVIMFDYVYEQKIFTVISEVQFENHKPLIQTPCFSIGKFYFITDTIKSNIRLVSSSKEEMRTKHPEEFI